MDEIGQRLKETSDNCIKCFEAWSKDKKNADVSEALQESVHELRRVASRLEIELAVSERDESVQKPIPIPPHRDANRRAQSADDDAGNRNSGPGPGGPRVEQKTQRNGRKTPKTKKLALLTSIT